jgi:hypothetical protein
MCRKFDDKICNWYMNKKKEIKGKYKTRDAG